MRHEFRLSLEINFDTADLQVLPEDSGRDLGYLDQLLDALAGLVRDTTWPESLQGEFLRYVTKDVYEFGCAIREEVAADRWTAAMSLIRPLQERSEYALAASVDSTFPDRYIKSINEQIDKNFNVRSRNLIEVARGAINRWAKKTHDQDGLLQSSITLNKIASEILHHAVGLSRDADKIVEARPGLLSMACGRVQCATANILLAAKVMGTNDTKAWQRALSVVALPPTD